VNDAPALREADVGVAMGLSGSDVTKAAADLVLLDDHFAIIVKAIELGRATFANVGRFLTYHLTDNVAGLAPFAAGALTGRQLPLAIGVLQVLALGIGTDMLPALALGAEPPSRRILSGRVRRRGLIDGRLLRRALLILGATEAACALATFVAVLYSRGWPWAATPTSSTLAVASGSASAAIALGQMTNAFACRSETLPVWRQKLLSKRLLVGAVAAELVLPRSFSAFRRLPDSWAAHGRPHLAGASPSAPSRSSSSSMQPIRRCAGGDSDRSSAKTRRGVHAAYTSHGIARGRGISPTFLGCFHG
jgi:magnesium-transporting ATPase (P-type)